MRRAARECAEEIASSITPVEVMVGADAMIERMVKIGKKFVERAIAESQIKYTRHAESSLDGCDPKNCQNREHFFYELGDGEPSPPPNIEAISARVHDSWMSKKRAQGFHGPEDICSQTNLLPRERFGCCKKYHADMIPYAELTEAKKELDRATVRTVLKAMGESGAAQEVSPPSPVRTCSTDSPHEAHTFGGRPMQYCPGTGEGEKSPEEHFFDATAPFHWNKSDVLKIMREWREKAEGDTRELKAALQAAIPFLFEHGSHQNNNCYRGSDDGCYICTGCGESCGGECEKPFGFVAAPLEPSAHDLAHRIWAIGYIGPVPNPTAADEAEIKLIAKMVSEWAAAFSKNLQEELAGLVGMVNSSDAGHTITAKKLIAAESRILELEKEITALRSKP